MAQARAVRIREPGDVHVLRLADVEVREPGVYEIAVDVGAAGLNRADLLQRRGLYPPPAGVPQDIPGLEYAGIVASVGALVTAFKPGDRVMGIVGGGGMCTRVIVHEREAMPIPATLSVEEAAAIPEVFLTAFDAMFRQADLKFGESVLIHSVGSGVGTAILQLAKVAGAFTIGTSRTESKLERCRAFGLDVGIVPEADRFADAVMEATRGRGADVILDAVGAAYLEENLRALAIRGRFVAYGSMSGASSEIAIGILMRKRAQLIGTVLRSRPMEEKAALAQAFAAQAVPLFERGLLKPVIDEVLPMREIAEAHRRLEKNATFGKLVLRWDS
jgi:putative PIG3 family NAD(P)H quinone oxidoreductase